MLRSNLPANPRAKALVSLRLSLGIVVSIKGSTHIDDLFRADISGFKRRNFYLRRPLFHIKNTLSFT